MNPLVRYRRAQLRLRRLFDPFTREHCASCATPCCRKPARIRPVDLVLLEELGHGPPPHRSGAAGAKGLVDYALGAEAEGAGEPCDFLGEGGCLFPTDLRPCGCVAFLCEPMRRLLPASELERLEEAVEELEAAYASLLASLYGDG